MVYKLLFSALVLLIGTPFVVQAQEVSPLVVETIRESTTPTTVRTGELFTQVYKIRYIYSESWGKEIIILEDEMRPKVYPASIGDFDIINWFLDEPLVTEGEETDEYARDLYVTLRIINPKKDVYVIPRFDILWAMKIGEEIETQEPFGTEEVYINYVTTVTEDPYLDIRDNVDFGDYSGQANLFWFVSRIVAPTFMLSAVMLLVFAFRSNRRYKVAQLTNKSLDDDQQEYIVELAPLTFNRAYRNFFKVVRYFPTEDSITKYADNDLDTERRILSKSISDVLRARLENINPGDTAVEIGTYINKNFETGHYKSALLYLQCLLVRFQWEIETKAPPRVICAADVINYKTSVRLLTRRWRILKYLGIKV